MYLYLKYYQIVFLIRYYKIKINVWSCILVQELHEHMLRLREQLIFCQIGREEAVESERELRMQLLEQGTLFHQQEAQMSDLRQRLNEAGLVRQSEIWVTMTFR